MPTFALARRAALAAVAVLWLGGGVPAHAAERHDLNLDAKGVMLHGYDPVAYFTNGAPTPGKEEFRVTHDGATYLFATAANRDAFLASPDKYVPAYGGFCAMGTALEKKLDGDPTVWRIVDGKLYLNVNADVQKRWVQDIAGHIAKADSVWPRIKDEPAPVVNAR